MIEVEMFLRGFERIDILKPVEVVDYKEHKNYISIVLKNAIEKNGNYKVQNSTEYVINKIFGKVNYRIEKSIHDSNIEVQISKVKMPETAYSPLDVLSSVDMSPDNLFLGIGKFGEEFINLNKITHAIICGATGYGKSSFIRYLIGVNCAYNKDALNLIFAIKPHEFIALQDHPRVISVLTNANEFEQGFNFIAEELARREYYLSKAFKVPPSNIDEFNKLAKENKLDLPYFKHIFVWVDEGKSLFASNHTGGYYNNDESITSMIFRARSAGIHLMFSAQRTVDIPSSFRHSISHLFTFYNPSIMQELMVGDMIYKARGVSDYENANGTIIESRNTDLVGAVDKAVKGRMSVFSVEGEYVSVQVPLVDQDTLQALAFDLYQEDENKFTPLKRSVQLVGDLYLPSYFFAENKTYEHFMNYEYLSKISLGGNNYSSTPTTLSLTGIKHNNRRNSGYDTSTRTFDCYKNPILKKGFIEDDTLEIKDVFEDVEIQNVVALPVKNPQIQPEQPSSEELLGAFAKELERRKKEKELEQPVKPKKSEKKKMSKPLNFKQALEISTKKVAKEAKNKKAK